MYFVTTLTKQRRKQFVASDVVDTCHEQLLRAAALRDFEILAYCYMPDHLHLLVRGGTVSASLSAFMKMAKQLSAYHVSRVHGINLWAKGYHDRIVREDENPEPYIAYIRNNPVKARLVASAAAYPFLWIDPRFQSPQLARP
jgi:putative transposase